MIKIKWNEVTSLSQVVALVLFIGVLVLGFFIGKKFENKNILGEPIAEARFVCPNQSFIDTDFYGGFVYMKLEGMKGIYLPQTISASGARYANADESIVFWNKGKTATIETEGEITYKDCIAE